MFIDNFYKINDVFYKDGKTIFKIILNKTHEIYKGHFPDQPIVPGVMQVQIVKELSSELIKEKLLLKSAGNIKYLALMDPEETIHYDVEISFEETEKSIFKIKAIISSSGKTYLKLNGDFIKVD